MASDLNRSIKIYIDNSDAIKKAKDLENNIATLREELNKLDAAGKKDTASYDKKARELEKAEAQQKKYKNAVQETERILKNLSGSTYKELLLASRTLNRELKNSERGTVQYTNKLKLYKQVQKELKVAQNEMNSSLGTQGTFFSRAANGFNKYFGMFTATAATITGVSFTLRKLSQDAAQMEDVYADVMKTTGLSREEVGELNEEFKKMDTRTAREELNELARDAGKLGISAKEDVLQFVEAGNQINVALGEDLGEDAIRNIGKITEVFKQSTQELSNMDIKGRMLAVGSAINELGQSSTASEEYLVNFTQRLGGVAAQAGISVQNILGYASALDQSGQAVEMSATAIQKFIMKMMGDAETFARIAGLEVEEFNRLLATDTNEAMKTVLRALSEKGGFQQLVPIFQEMGLDGARAVGVLSSLATNIHLVDEAQRISNDAFAEGISLTNEYNVKNENAAAELAKRKQAFKDAAEELGRRLNPALLTSTNYITYLVKLLPGFLDFLGKYGKFILYLATSYAVYTAVVKISTLWNTKFKEALTLSSIQMRLQNALMTAAKVAVLAYNVVLALFTGNTIKLRAAWKLLNATMATNPIGLIAVAATAAIAGIVKLVKHLTRASAAAKAVADATKQFGSEEAAARREVQSLFSALQLANPESNTYLQIRKEIISKYGKYLQGLIDEKGNITDIAEAIKRVNQGLREQIALKIRNAATEQIMEASIEKQTKNVEKVMKRIGKQVSSETVRSAIQETINRTISEFETSGSKDYDALQRKLLSEIQGTYGVAAYKGMRNVKNAIVDLVNDIKKSGDAVDEVKSKFNGMISEMTEISTIVTNSPVIDNEDPDDLVTPFSSAGSDKNKYDEKIKALESYILREKNALLKQLQDREINEQQYARQMEALEKERLAKMLEIYEVGSDKRIEIENLLIEKKQAILKKIEDDELSHQQRLLELQEKAEKARQEQNLKALKAIAKQNEENYKKEFERRVQQRQEMIALTVDFSNELGSLLGGVISGNEDLVASSLKAIINMGLDVLKVQVQMAVAGATAQSLAQPDSIMTFGASGFARAAILVGLIEAAFAAVKGVVNSALNNLGGGKNSSSLGDSTSSGERVVQYAGGKYDVIGNDDGRTYRNVSYLGVTTGIVPRPALVGEYGPELVVSAPDLARLQRHINYPMVVQAIQESRVPQRASGKYDFISSTTTQATPSFDYSVMDEIRNLLLHLKQNGIRSEVNYNEFKRAEEKIDSIKSKARRN